MAKASQMCKDRKMILFEPRDATANAKVYDNFEKHDIETYWINIKRPDATKQDFPVGIFRDIWHGFFSAGIYGYVFLNFYLLETGSILVMTLQSVGSIGDQMNPTTL